MQQLLDMRTGTRFNEDYEDLDSDVRVYEQVYLWRPREASAGLPADALAYYATLGNDGEHGGPFRYRSILTDVLGWVLERAGGARLHELISRELWEPMGAEFDAEITLDGHGNAMADGGVCATLRDLARFGLLMARRGMAGDRQLLPAAWVSDILRGAPDGAQAYQRGMAAGGYPADAHYRNCWWVRDPGAEFFYGAGIYGQNVYVYLPTQTVVAKLSTWPTALSAAFGELTVDAALALSAALAAGQI